ncbi:MAG: hypothetical protein QGI08_13715 [Paracoccaceae bacterium]|nr:hypothetical protein [Paracoccaceae bacterium]
MSQAISHMRRGASIGVFGMRGRRAPLILSGERHAMKTGFSITWLAIPSKAG